MDFCLATTLLYDAVHAANFALLYERVDDYFEDSLIAEPGFELESRLLGLQSEQSAAAHDGRVCQARSGVCDEVV
jgi:hypothetical protein